MLALGAGAMCASLPSLAQQQSRIRRIGHLGISAEVSALPLAAFRQGMTELRWSEGRDYAIDARYVDDGGFKALPVLAAELARLQPEVMLITGEASIPALVQAMKSVPIVLASSSDPVGLGFVKSLQRPGGNITGLTSLSSELGAKRLEMLKESFPRASHVAALIDGPSSQLKIIEDAAARLKLRLTEIRFRQDADIEPGLKRAAALGVNAYVVTTGPLLANNVRLIVAGIARARVPAIFGQGLYVEAGGLMSYSASLTDGFRRAAAYVDKILKGAKPGDLPIEQPTKFELVINMKTAKAMGFAIPQSILLRAERVIE